MTLWIPSTEPAPRRVKVLSLTPDLIFALLKSFNDGPRTLSATGLPADAQFVGCCLDLQLGLLHLYIQSATFDEVAAGNMVAELRMSFTEHFGERVYG